MIDFFSPRQIFSVHLVFQCLDLFQGFLECSSSLELAGYVHNRPNTLKQVSVLVYHGVAHSVVIGQ